MSTVVLTSVAYQTYKVAWLVLGTGLTYPAAVWSMTNQADIRYNNGGHSLLYLKKTKAPVPIRRWTVSYNPEHDSIFFTFYVT